LYAHRIWRRSVAHMQVEYEIKDGFLHFWIPLLGASRVRGPLCRRELEVLAAAQRGLCNKEIANELHLSVSTVKFWMGRVLKKAGVTRRYQLLEYATSTLRS
jgi:DNA-binding NarL/FixJ family response regulator